MLNFKGSTFKQFFRNNCKSAVDEEDTFCSIYTASFDRKAAQKTVSTYRTEQNLMEYVNRSRTKHRVPGRLSETFTGKEYGKGGDLLNFLNESNTNITCTFNSDGIQPVESSKKTVWPILCSENDLDNRYKPNFILLAAIWFGTNKPDADAFFKNFVEQGNQLSSEDLKWFVDGIEHRSRILFNICDSVTRCAFAV